MAGTGGRRAGAGRPKGAKSLKTKGREQRALTAIAQVAALAMPATGILMPLIAPNVAPEGISPKDLLLTTMRMAWESAHAKAAEAREMDALAAGASDSDTMESFRKTANELRVEAGRHVAIAQSAAKDAAPYMHPKLATQDLRLSGNLVVALKQYPAA